MRLIRPRATRDSELEPSTRVTVDLATEIVQQRLSVALCRLIHDPCGSGNLAIPGLCRASSGGEVGAIGLGQLHAALFESYRAAAPGAAIARLAQNRESGQRRSTA